MVDINRLGKEYEIYTTVNYIGKGFPIILPRGARIIRILRNFVESELQSKGYKVVRTPSMSNSQIYKIEDRYESGKDKMFVIKNYEEEKSSIVLKPYVPPFHCTIYNENQHSYKELPIKYCETSTVFRNDMDIKGIVKTRQITLSDASVFCEPQKVEESIKEAIKIQQKYINKLDLGVTYCISTWDENEKENYIGTPDEWKNVVQSMKNALSDLNINYTVNKKGRMYGPSIKVKHNNKTFISIQIDFEIVHRFDTKYADNDSTNKYPVYIHYTVVGSYEKLLAMLIERYKGDFPLWLAPVQVVVISESQECEEYANEIRNEISKSGIRAETENTNDNYRSKIKKQQKLNIPYIVTVGKKEVENNTIKLIKGENKKSYNLDELIKEVEECQKQS